MLLNDFYTISNQENLPDSLKATLTLNKNHKIFKGHFPGHPVVPGVCMMQIVREVMELSTGKKLRIAGADFIKFLTIINPEQNSVVDMTVSFTQEADKYLLNATLFFGSTTFFKFRSTLQSA
jgi:3-hydroxyacyl-[acyl-carrier-protein] dehydratase